MIHIDTKDGKLSCRMVGKGDDLIIELAYGVARYHIKTSAELQDLDFDPARDKRAYVNASVETFSELFRAVLDEVYDRKYHIGEGNALQ